MIERRRRRGTANDGKQSPSEQLNAYLKKQEATLGKVAIRPLTTIADERLTRYRAALGDALNNPNETSSLSTIIMKGEAGAVFDNTGSPISLRPPIPMIIKVANKKPEERPTYRKV